MIEANKLSLSPPPSILCYNKTFTATSGDLTVEYPQIQESILNAGIDYEVYMQLKEDWNIFFNNMVVCNIISNNSLVRSVDNAYIITFDENEQMKLPCIKDFDIIKNSSLCPSFTSRGVILKSGTKFTVTQTMSFIRKL